MKKHLVGIELSIIVEITNNVKNHSTVYSADSSPYNRAEDSEKNLEQVLL